LSSCSWSANESLPLGVQKVATARKVTRANTITPTEIQPVFPIGTFSHQVFLSFITGWKEQAKCQVGLNGNLAIFKGWQKSAGSGAAINWACFVQKLRMS
jgi:hypothetical protein